MVEVLTVDLRKSTGEQTKQTNKDHVMNQSFIRVSYVCFPPSPLFAGKKNVGNKTKSWVEAFLRHLWHGHGHPMHLWHALGEETVGKRGRLAMVGFRYRSLKIAGFVPRNMSPATKKTQYQSTGEIWPTDMYIYNIYIYIDMWKIQVLWTPQLGAKHSSFRSIICISSAFLCGDMPIL